MKKKALEELQQFFDKNEDTNKQFKSMFGSEWFEGPIGQNMFALEDHFVKALSVALDISIDDLNWFVYECEFGKRESECILKDGSKIVVRDIDTFLETV
jgi:hypothetical protein